MSRDYLLVGSTSSAAPTSPQQLELFPPRIQQQLRPVTQASVQQRQKQYVQQGEPARDPTKDEFGNTIPIYFIDC